LIVTFQNPNLEDGIVVPQNSNIRPVLLIERCDFQISTANVRIPENNNGISVVWITSNSKATITKTIMTQPICPIGHLHRLIQMTSCVFFAASMSFLLLLLCLVVFQNPNIKLD
jgi:hypothetical protein